MIPQKYRSASVLESFCKIFSLIFICRNLQVEIRKLFQKDFRIVVNNTSICIMILAKVQDILAHQLPKPLFRKCAFFSVPQMPGLFWRCLAAVLDFIRRAAVLLPVIDQHIKFSAGELELADLIPAAQGLGGFQQNDVFQHPPPDFFEDSAGDICPVLLAQAGKQLVLHQSMDKRLRLAVTHSRLSEEDMLYRFTVRRGRFNGAVHDEVQRGKVFLDLCHMDFRNWNGLFLLVADVQNVHEPFRNGFCINLVQSGCPFFRVTFFS